MKIFGRSPARYFYAIRHLPEVIVQAGRAIRLFRQPFKFLAHYARRTLPDDRIVTLRNGMTLHLSEHRADIITVFTVFVRRDYGTIAPNSTIIDVGANIGMFSLYAIISGAKKVLAFEPSLESYETLKKTIAANKLEQKIEVYPYAVWDEITTVHFPKASNVMNKVVDDSQPTSTETFEVKTTTVGEILDSAKLSRVDLFKLDCEGAEYRIIPSVSAEQWRRIGALRLEYHQGKLQELVDHLSKFGFAVKYIDPPGFDHLVGVAWLERSLTS